VQPPPGGLCPDCESAEAWSRYATPGRKLVIDRAALAEAEARQRVSNAGQSVLVRGLNVLPSLLSLGLGVSGLAFTVALFGHRELRPMADILAGLAHTARWATVLGGGGLVLAVVALVRLRRGRLFRSWPLLAAGGAGMLAGSVSAVVGGLHWHAVTTGIGWKHTTIPALTWDVTADPIARSVAEATVVILAPDRHGNARGLSIGSGAVIHAAKRRAWIVTCSHVCMPYAAVASFRDPKQAHPVWVYFWDGRNLQGEVKWTAPPPLDVAVVAVHIENPPRPVPVFRSADAIGPGTDVLFVPNPLRSGWLVHRGQVTKREPHFTPAGRYTTLYTDLPVQQGDSGTGLFDARGNLMGSNTWLRVDSEGARGISLPSEAMERILDLIERDALDMLDEGPLRGDSR